ncbi:hypothetical protein QR685DRAFT_254500 [Neurospora intermedia]|uniref:Uncharacterized protein n=1 Tax=Neurospora intermedia TaxID=5142 RepID=A0ABR3DCR9_NEUIN
MSPSIPLRISGYKEAFARPLMENKKVANVNPTAIPQSLRETLEEKGFQSPDQLSHQIRTVTVRARDRFAAANDETFN